MPACLHASPGRSPRPSPRVSLRSPLPSLHLSTHSTLMHWSPRYLLAATLLPTKLVPPSSSPYLC
jgi:hypothetical protein